MAVKSILAELTNHKLSIGKAAEQCNVSLWKMLESAKKNKIDWTGYSKEDIKKDLELLKEKRLKIKP